MFKEPELPSRYGEFGADGELVKEAQYCAVTGQRIEAGDPTIGVQGSKRFYRVKASVYRLMTREDHEALYAEIQRGGTYPVGSTFDAQAGVVTIAEPAPSKPAYTWDAQESTPAINTNYPTTKPEVKSKDVTNG